MRAFPAELSALMSRNTVTALSRSETRPEFVQRHRTPIVMLPNVVQQSDDCIALLERRMRPLMRRMTHPIPADIIPRMRKNYTERLPKTMRVLSASLNGNGTKAVKAARAIGLIDMLQSESLRAIAERVTGLRLDPRCAMQVICYEHGDYSGPHNDHQPEEAHLRNGYVDLHIMFANQYVASQQLVYERRGFLSEVVDVSRGSAITIYRLPFWHQVTPLVARPGKEGSARRWLLLASFTIA